MVKRKGVQTRKLTPSQEEVVSSISNGIQHSPITMIWAEAGYGKTTMLEELHRRHGGKLLRLGEFVDYMRSRDPLSLEESFLAWISAAAKGQKHLYVDDLQLLDGVVCCHYHYQRRGWLTAPLNALKERTAIEGWRLTATGSGIPGAWRGEIWTNGIKEPTRGDYEVWLAAFFGPAAAGIDVAKVFRFAPRLNAYQLRNASRFFRDAKTVTADALIDTLREKNISSNVDLGEVRPVSLSTLRGIEDVVRELEAKIVMPLEDDKLATELSLVPKRGVLLAGPPGTGKTTIGRALAHRLRGKFFSIDGTMIAGTENFYSQVKRVFDFAKQNAPAVIFIDDADVIFESGEETGLYRYLLTMLDGIESESNAAVCVMLTAMNVGSLPPALVRSGRIELWLSTKLPDAQARLAILRDYASTAPEPIKSASIETLVEPSEGLTGADLQRAVADAKLLYAYDKHRQQPLRAAEDYLADAIKTVREQQVAHARAQAELKAQPKPARGRGYPVFVPSGLG
jgi:ATP-dependent 26S proteasome regulatory subunit